MTASPDVEPKYLLQCWIDYVNYALSKAFRKGDKGLLAPYILVAFVTTFQRAGYATGGPYPVFTYPPQT